MPNEARTLDANEVQRIRSASSRYAEAVRANEGVEVARFFTPEAIRMPPNEPLHEGRDAIISWVAGFEFSDYSVSLSQVQGAANMAFARGTYAVTLTPRDAGSAITDSGNIVELWTRGSERIWRIASQIWNSDRAVSLTGSAGV